MPDGLSEHSIYIGAGDVMVRELDDPNAGYQPLGNCTTFSLQPKVVEIEDVSNMVDTFGNTLASMSMPDGVEISLSLSRYSKLVWAAMLGADIETLAQTSSEDHSCSLVLPHGQWVRTEHFKISDVSVQEGSVVGVEGVDYLVKAEAGMIMSLATGSLTDGATCTVTYDYGDLPADAYKLLGAKQGSVKLGLFVDGINKYTGRRLIVEIPEATFAPSEAVGLITGKENGKASLKGKILTTSGDAGFTQTML